MAMPPPRPESLGEFTMEKFGGVRELRAEEGEPGLIQVSVRARISRLLLRMKSWIRAGLSSRFVTERADRAFRLAKDKQKGPGLLSTSPDKRRRRRKKNIFGLVESGRLLEEQGQERKERS